jgi:FMN-dependent NADH-azoreductase
LAREDLARYVKWDLQQKQIAQVTREILGAQARQQSEQQRRFTEFAQRIAGKFTQPA